MIRNNLLLLSLVLACTSACAREGELEVRTYGEEFIEQGIPADMLDDAWAIEFSRFEVTLRDVAIAGATLPDPAPIDLVEPSAGEGQRIGLVTAPVGDHDDLEFTLVRLSLDGSASKGDVSKTFAWDFELDVRFGECETLTQVDAAGIAGVEITIHADHLFYDSLVAEAPALRFDAIAAADADADGTITREELAATDIGAYDPGNLPIDDLWSFLHAQAATTAHVDGEGHCAPLEG